MAHQSNASANLCPTPDTLALATNMLIAPDFSCTVTERESKKEQRHLLRPLFNLSLKCAHCHHLHQQLPLQLAQIIMMLLQLRE